jgi:hypothetical protein
MATHEVMLGFAYLYGTLSIDATLLSLAPGGVYRALAPPVTATPYVIISYQAGTDIVNFRGVRGLASMLYQAKVVGPSNNTANLATAAARIDTVITTADQVSVTGGIIKACFRAQPLQVDELVTGEQWSNIGGLYRIMVTAT